MEEVKAYLLQLLKHAHEVVTAAQRRRSEVGCLNLPNSYDPVAKVDVCLTMVHMSANQWLICLIGLLMRGCQSCS